MRESAIFCFFFIFLACTSVQAQNKEKVHTRQRKRFSSFEIFYDHSAPRNAGSIIPLGIKAVKKNGDILLTKGYFKGTLPWSKFHIDVKGAKFTHESIWISNMDISETIIVTVYPKDDTSNVKSIEIPIDFKGAQKAVFSGADGRNGRPGQSGSDNNTGTGYDGDNGENGEHGQRGPDLDVWVDLAEKDSSKYLLVEISDLTNRTKQTIKVNVDGGSLLILARGGKGGDGGEGGAGGDGGKGGYGGNGGYGGHGGDGGEGGKVVLHLSPGSVEYAHLITVNNAGGHPGKGGRGGRRGYGASDFKSDSETKLGKVLDGSGNGSKGYSGNDGREGIRGSDPVIVLEP